MYTLRIERLEGGLRVLCVLVVAMMLLAGGCSTVREQEIILVRASDYGYSPDKAVTCGGGIKGERDFLSRLRGPEGQSVRATRISDCCHFRLQSAPDEARGYLSRYELSWSGSEYPVIIYLNGFVRAPVRAPDGLAIAD